MPLLRKKSTISNNAVVEVPPTNFPTVPSEIISLILSYLELTNILKLSRVSHSFLESLKQVQYINFTHLKISFNFEKIFRVLIPKFPQLQKIKFHSQINGFNFGFDNFSFLTDMCPFLKVLDFHHCKYLRLENCEKGFLLLIKTYGPHLTSLSLRIDHLNIAILECLILHCHKLQSMSIHASDYEFFKYDFPQFKLLPNSIPLSTTTTNMDLHSVLQWRCKTLFYLLHVLWKLNKHSLTELRVDRLFDFWFEKTPTYSMLSNEMMISTFAPSNQFATNYLFQNEFLEFDHWTLFCTLTQLHCFKMEHVDTVQQWFPTTTTTMTTHWTLLLPTLSHSITKISIAHCKVYGSILEQLLFECTQLTWFNMSHVILLQGNEPLQICHSQLQILLAVKMNVQTLRLHCPHLIQLDLEQSEKLTLLQFDIPSIHLKHVNLVKCTHLNDQSIANICKSCPQVTQLKLLECRSLLEPQIEKLEQLKLLYVIATKWEYKHCIQLLQTCSQVSQITFLGIKSDLSLPCSFQTNTNVFCYSPFLNEVCFSSCKGLSHEFLTLLMEQCKNLSSFILRFNDSIEHCFFKTKHSKLQHFEFKSCSKVTNHFMKQLVWYCPYIKSLHIMYCSSIQKLAFTSHSLVELKIEGVLQEMTSLEDVKCKQIQELSILNLNSLKFSSSNLICLQQVKSIRLKHCATLDGNDIASLVKQCHHLQHLTIKYCKQIEQLELHSMSLQNLSIHHCNHLQTITLSHTLQQRLMEIVIKKCDKLNIEQFLDHLHNRRLSLNTYINHKSIMVKLQQWQQMTQEETNNIVQETVLQGRNKKNCLVM